MKRLFYVLAIVSMVYTGSLEAKASAPTCPPSPTGNTLYVSVKGSARGAGTKESPLKDLQKAIDKAATGDVIRIAEGNYLGPLERGYIEVEGKYISLEGGWNEAFTERNPMKYITRIQPGKQQAGTIGGSVCSLSVKSDRNGEMIIDGIFFDLGLLHNYQPATADPRNGWPEGCETGRIKPVIGGANQNIRILSGTFAGKLTVRNCMFLNASHFGIQLTLNGGKINVYNNVFVANLYAAVEVYGGLNQQRESHMSKIEFHHNTVLFSWCRTKEMEDMGYGYRFRNSIDHDVHHNIFGCSNLGALDLCWFDEHLLKDNQKKICSAHDNRFFMNKGDAVIPGSSGGKWIYVPAKRFDEVEQLNGEYERNSELGANSKIKDVITPAYLKGYAQLKVLTTESYDANSAANLYREAHGLNKMGTSTTRVSMFGNRYNFNDAMKLFGVEPGYGAQKIK